MEDGGLLAQRGNQFRREQIPARLTGDEHEGFRFQRPDFKAKTQRRGENSVAEELVRPKSVLQ